MHIALLNPQGNFDPADSYWTEHPDFGGQLVYVKEIGLAMADAGHRVDILTRRILDPAWPEFAHDLDSYPDEENLRIVRIPCGPDTFLAKERLWPHLKEWVDNIRAFYHAGGALPDVFSAHYGDGGLAGVLLQDITNIPFTFTGHSLGAQKMDKLGVNQDNLEAMLDRYQFHYRIAAERLSMNHAGRIITSTRQERLEQYGHPLYHKAVDPERAQRFAVIPPGVNRTIFSPEPSGLDADIRSRIEKAIHAQLPSERAGLPLVLASSRLDPKKNHLAIVQAFAQSPELQTLANFALVVRGVEDPLRNPSRFDGGERQVMDSITALLDASGGWEWSLGFPLNSQEELAAAFRVLAERHSVFVLTALYEPFGLAPLEAMSCGLPAVVTDKGGPSESMLEGATSFGVLVDPQDPNAIAEGLISLLASKATWRRYHRAGIQRVVDTYTWTRTAEAYLEVFSTLLKGKGTAARTIPVPPDFTSPGEEQTISLHSFSAQLASIKRDVSH